MLKVNLKSVFGFFDLSELFRAPSFVWVRFEHPRFVQCLAGLIPNSTVFTEQEQVLRYPEKVFKLAEQVLRSGTWRSVPSTRTSIQLLRTNAHMHALNTEHRT